MNPQSPWNWSNGSSSVIFNIIAALIMIAGAAFWAQFRWPQLRWLLRLGRKAVIIDPKNKGEVARNLALSGLRNRFYPNHEYWIVLKSTRDARFYPDGGPIPTIGAWKWSVQVTVGPPEPPGVRDEYVIMLVRCNSVGADQFHHYWDNTLATQNAQGLARLPDDCSIEHQIVVRRTS